MEIIKWNEILLPYEQAVEELRLKFRNMQKEFIKCNQHCPIEEVTGRVKKIGSILEKANRKNIAYEDIEKKIDDIAGVRIICKFVEDIDKVAEFIKNRNGKDLCIVQEKNYIDHQKPSGYRSYHLIIKYPVVMVQRTVEIHCEIQIRTMAMNFWATIEHSLKYKYNDNIPEALQQRLRITAEAAFHLDQEMGTIRGEILEAQKIIQRKNELVDRILKKMQQLYFHVELSEMNRINQDFVVLYAENDIEKLQQFNEQLNIIAHVYKVETENALS